ncbi:hypothetical protein [Marinimicrobium alkaliphilum]|uniref:hypothetical protein n=1 Tax=Marinimicrobium alkaliphilum TaxID=2202654 RepID=UPI000DBA385A|nr:hypothetical protein [Marinimicrobium alkaliphilum]
MTALLLSWSAPFGFAAEEDGSISPFSDNPWYWAYRGEPVLLRGATDDDNLFQWTGETLTNHLDLLVSVGGNYVRNTMSDRETGNVYAFKEDDEGVYDLDQWNDEYWDRFETFLRETHKRGIIVQLTLWDQFDLSPEHPWLSNKNIDTTSTSAGTEAASGQEVFHEFSRSDFYNAVEDNNENLLQYQRKYVDKLLSYTLSYGHVLYNINNESSEGAVWENYWAQHLNQAGREAGRDVYVTSMQFDPSNSVRHVMSFPDIYGFYEISQNNQDSRGARGHGHWDNIMHWRQKIASHGPKPMNNEKVYGGGDGVNNYSAGTETEAINRFWRNIFAGSASSRFHRPTDLDNTVNPRTWGSGLNARVQTNLKAMDMLLEELDIFSTSPHNDLLSHAVAATPAAVEAYVLANIGKQYAVYFPQGRYMVNLDPWVYVDRVEVRWLDIDQLTWSEPEVVEVRWEGSELDWGDRGTISLKTPSNRSYVVLVTAIE